MGMNLFKGHSRSCGCPPVDPSLYDSGVAPVSPKPKHVIRQLRHNGIYTVAAIRWPDVTNFEGRKVLVYRATPQQLRAAIELDPHFCEETGPLVPIARFEPTTRGWVNACRFVEAIT